IATVAIDCFECLFSSSVSKDELLFLELPVPSTDTNPDGIKTMKHAQDVFQAPQDIKKTGFKTPTPNQPVTRNEKYKNTKNTSTLVYQGSPQRTKEKSIQSSNIISCQGCFCDFRT
uniref:hypothetical protein n=1 Tax=Escherichia coli TaxID=562 RepID=UPI00200CEAF7